MGSPVIDWTIVISAGIAALPLLVAQLVALVQAFRTHKLVNGGMAKLVETTRSDATATATLAEKAAEINRQGAAALEKARQANE